MLLEQVQTYRCWAEEVAGELMPADQEYEIDKGRVRSKAIRNGLIFAGLGGGWLLLLFLGTLDEGSVDFAFVVISFLAFVLAGPIISYLAVYASDEERAMALVGVVAIGGLLLGAAAKTKGGAVQRRKDQEAAAAKARAEAEQKRREEEARKRQEEQIKEEQERQRLEQQRKQDELARQQMDQWRNPDYSLPEEPPVDKDWLDGATHQYL